MKKLHTVLALLLVVDVSLYAWGCVSLWHAASKIVALERQLKEAMPGEVYPEPTPSLFGRTTKLANSAFLCTMPTRKWLLVPVLGTLMTSKQYHLHAQCLQARLQTTTTLREQSTTASVRTIMYGMVLLMTGAKLTV